MIRFEMYEDLDDEVMDSLRDQYVDMDDWDYMLFVEDCFREHFSPEQHTSSILVPNSHKVEGLLNGSCSNLWYAIDNFMGQKGILGVAYHS